jgi:hypothetical protein
LWARESQINNRNLRTYNGIRVEEPKVYDDALLQQMLRAAETRLTALQVLDQGTIVQRLGSVSGATQQISSFGLSVQGPSLPGSAITSSGATGSTQITQSENGSNSIPKGNTTVTTSGLPVQNVVTTLSQANPPPVAAPAPTTSLPSSFSVSSSDILNEQMQLTYEIANLRLLLEGSLTDRFDKSRRIVKPRVTLGFPIILEPDERYKDAVAIVEVKVKRDRTANEVKQPDGEPPVVTALLPREKTYNVAAITDHSTSIGGGIVTQLVGVSGSFLRARKTYYLAQDQDTLALTFPPDDNLTHEWIGFLWQFRPVLGQHFVRSGLKQTFVQIAFPKVSDTDNFGEVHVETYWRRYDRDRGILKDVVPGSLREMISSANIPSFKFLVPDPTEDIAFNPTSLEDIGGGLMIVSLEGQFLQGTSIRVGALLIGPEPSPVFSFDSQRIRFIAPIADLATKTVAIVGRDGTERPLVMKRRACSDTDKIKINKIDIKTVDQANSLVNVEVNSACFLKEEYQKGEERLPPLVLVIANRVFGYSDAPVQRVQNTLSAVVPTILLLSNPRVTVKALFQKEDSQDSFPIAGLFGSPPPGRTVTADSSAKYLYSQTERLILLDSQEKQSVFLLYGNRLNEITILLPDGEGAESESVPGADDGTTLLKITLAAERLKTAKYLILKRQSDRPFLIQIPAPPPKDGAPTFKQTERITVGADEVVVEGEGLDDLENVTFNKIPLNKERVGDKAIKLKGLFAKGVTAAAGTKTLTFSFRNNPKSVQVKIDVVSSIVETVPRN